MSGVWTLANVSDMIAKERQTPEGRERCRMRFVGACRKDNQIVARIFYRGTTARFSMSPIGTTAWLREGLVTACEHDSADVCKWVARKLDSGKPEIGFGSFFHRFPKLVSFSKLNWNDHLPIENPLDNRIFVMACCFGANNIATKHIEKMRRRVKYIGFVCACIEQRDEIVKLHIAQEDFDSSYMALTFKEISRMETNHYTFKHFVSSITEATADVLDGSGVTEEIIERSGVMPTGSNIVSYCSDALFRKLTKRKSFNAVPYAPYNLRDLLPNNFGRAAQLIEDLAVSDGEAITTNSGTGSEIVHKIYRSCIGIVDLIRIRALVNRVLKMFQIRPHVMLDRLVGDNEAMNTNVYPVIFELVKQSISVTIPIFSSRWDTGEIRKMTKVMKWYRDSIAVFRRHTLLIVFLKRVAMMYSPSAFARRPVYI